MTILQFSKVFVTHLTNSDLMEYSLIQECSKDSLVHHNTDADAIAQVFKLVYLKLNVGKNSFLLQDHITEMVTVSEWGINTTRKIPAYYTVVQGLKFKQDNEFTNVNSLRVFWVLLLFVFWFVFLFPNEQFCSSRNTSTFYFVYNLWLKNLSVFILSADSTFTQTCNVESLIQTPSELSKTIFQVMC